MNLKTFMSLFRVDQSTADTSLNASVAHLRRQIARLVQASCKPAVFQQQVLFRLADILQQVEELISGTLTFQSTETWRTVYEAVLSSCVAKRYLSVAIIRSEDYWQDSPGQTSLEFNYQLIDHGFFVHRIFVIDEFFWPPTMASPAKEVLKSISVQHGRGIEVGLVRLSALRDEPELVTDMGIYGEQAVGFQQTDFQGKTTHYEICFQAERVRLAEQRWSQLQLYAISFDQDQIV